ncbi:MAG: hypothetical protein O3B24_04555 [Verrucomicrobia bacterium]|nr:hypothetical protein [Verrucomicrobiota bacterium]
MAYYPKDAAAVQRLRDQIEALGVPLILMRKFIQLIGAITVQVEDEYASRKVIATVFAALLQQAEEIRQPESDRIKELIEACRSDVEKRLGKREARTSARTLSPPAADGSG